MKCANCDEDALFQYRLTLEKSVFYCGRHLPRFLDDRRKAGLLKITEQHDVHNASALAALAVIQPDPVVEETEEVVEEIVAPKPKATKKTTKKSAK